TLLANDDPLAVDAQRAEEAANFDRLRAEYTEFDPEREGQDRYLRDLADFEDDTAHCYLCYLDEHGKPDTSEKMDQGPLRKVVRRSITAPNGDTTEVLHLECGHAII